MPFVLRASDGIAGSRRRFPAGMTERGARARAGAVVLAASDERVESIQTQIPFGNDRKKGKRVPFVLRASDGIAGSRRRFPPGKTERGARARASAVVVAASDERVESIQTQIPFGNDNQEKHGQSTGNGRAIGLRGGVVVEVGASASALLRGWSCLCVGGSRLPGRGRCGPGRSSGTRGGRSRGR